MFQSSPDPRGPGVPLRSTMASSLKSFNPRPTLAGRASSSINRVESLCRFQSSPDPRGPGVRMRDAAGSGFHGFNPRPTLAGRASGYMRITSPTQNVSILARPSRAGRPQHEHVTGCFADVSILARPSRAGRPFHTEKSPSFKVFQSSPDPRGPGVRRQRTERRREHLFQSSPDPRGPGVCSHATSSNFEENTALCANFSSSVKNEPATILRQSRFPCKISVFRAARSSPISGNTSVPRVI